MSIRKDMMWMTEDGEIYALGDEDDPGVYQHRINIVQKKDRAEAVRRHCGSGKVIDGPSVYPGRDVSWRPWWGGVPMMFPFRGKGKGQIAESPGAIGLWEKVGDDPKEFGGGNS